MNANWYIKKIEMTKSEAKAAGNIKSEKFEELRQYIHSVNLQFIRQPTTEKV